MPRACKILLLIKYHDLAEPLTSLFKDIVRFLQYKEAIQRITNNEFLAYERSDIYDLSCFFLVIAFIYILFFSL